MDPLDAQNAALHLEGVELEGGWTVGQMNTPDPAATGGYFSVTYPVTGRAGQQGFLKVLNLARAFGQINAVDVLQSMTAEFQSERDLCVMCGERRLSKVVTAIAHGELVLPGYLLGNVSYIIFELATHDVRVALAQGRAIDHVVKLEYLHNIALGLRQLHGVRVAHQDLKPSNFLVFPEDNEGRANGKLADLGRAFVKGTPSLHDQMTVPGDRSYAPPEQLYGHVYPDEAARRYAADMYQLGSLICFIFAGATMNARLTIELAPEHHWTRWGDGYDQVLPYVTDAHARVLEYMRPLLPPAIADELISMVDYLCQPDALLRGHPAARRQKHSSPYALQRVVTQIDLIARREAVSLR